MTDSYGTKRVYFLQTPGACGRPRPDAAPRGASARPGGAAGQLGSEPPRCSWGAGPVAAPTCGARGAGPSSDPSGPGIRNAVALATSEATGAAASARLQWQSRGPGAQHAHCSAALSTPTAGAVGSDLRAREKGRVQLRAEHPIPLYLADPPVSVNLISIKTLLFHERGLKAVLRLRPL